MSNKQNDIILEAAYEAQCEDMRMRAVEEELERLNKDMNKLRLQVMAERIRGLAQQKKIDLLSERLDNVLGAIVIARGEADR